jgi:hypothetical protein
VTSKHGGERIKRELQRRRGAKPRRTLASASARAGCTAITMKPASATPSSRAREKRRRSRSPPGDGDDPGVLKSSRPRLGGGGGGSDAGGAWEHLDLVLSLQGKELSLERYSASAPVYVTLSYHVFLFDEVQFVVIMLFFLLVWLVHL